VQALPASFRLFLPRTGPTRLEQAFLALCRHCLSRADSICLVQILCGSCRFYLSHVDSRQFKQVPPVSSRLWEVSACSTPLVHALPVSCRFWWFFHVQPVSYSLAGYLLALFNMYHLSLLLDSSMFSGLSTNGKLRTISYAVRDFFLQCLNLLSTDCCCVQSGVPCVHRVLYTQQNISTFLMFISQLLQNRRWQGRT
jgi:hypothetical protein